MDILVKVSGSLVESHNFYEWLASHINPSDNLCIICGGGAKISQVLKQNNIDYKFGKKGREIKSPIGRRLALEVLKEQKLILEKRLKEKKIDALVLIPAIEKRGNIFHMNGDNLVLALYPNFDRGFIVTLPDKALDKAKYFSGLEKIKIVPCLR